MCHGGTLFLAQDRFKTGPRLEPFGSEFAPEPDHENRPPSSSRRLRAHWRRVGRNLGHSGRAAPLSTFGVDATQLGVRAGGGADQSNMLQSAIDQTAGARVPLMLGPGEYRVGGLRLPGGTQIVGVRGATRLIFTGGRR